MKKVLLIIAIAGSLISCESPKDEYYTATKHVCNCQEIEKLQAFMNSKVIKASNNMSDEEMEDVIAELRRTAIEIYCPQRPVPHIRKAGERWGEIDFTKVDSCQFIMY